MDIKLNSNYDKYPNNFFNPEYINVYGDTYRYYLVRFNNLYEIYDFLANDPEVNNIVFKELHSRTGTTNFAGLPYDKALEDLINFDDEEYMDFLNLVKEIANVRQGDIHKYKLIHTVAGGYLNTPLYSVGSPLCYETEERIKKPKFINIYSALSYNSSTSKYQVFNRAVVLISIISALEKNGYSINLNAFEMSQCGYEIVNNVVGLKKHGEKTNIQALYKTSCKVEFLRRILFAVLETVPVLGAWGSGYGKSSDEDFVRKVLHVQNNDIYFGTPSELDISGSDLTRDFHRCLEKLKLTDRFSLQDVDEEFEEKIKKLVK